MEVWKDIEGYEGKYLVSNEGRVQSLYGKGRYLKQKTDRYGYKCVALSKEGKLKHFTVHRLVALTFIDNQEGFNTVNHKDLDKTNNCVSNLEWCSNFENVKHYYNHSVEGCFSSLTNEQILEIVEMYKQGKTYSEIHSYFNIRGRVDMIGEIVSGRRFSELTGIKEDLRERDRHFKLSDEQVYEILDLRLNKKEPLLTIANKYGIRESQVSRICTGVRRKDVYDRFLNQEGS